VKADLHVHSTASDGSLSAVELVAMAAEARVEVLAVCDHDSVESVLPAATAASAAGITLIPAVELSASRERGDLHILAYFVDPLDPTLLANLGDLRDSRLRRAERMVSSLRSAGYDISLEQVLAISDGGAVGRSHVARALVDAGHAADVSEAFKRFIGRERPFYVAKDGPGPAEVVRTVVACGAVPVLAHPGISHADDEIPGLIEAGLRGIEAYHADHDLRQRRRYATMAGSLGLLVTGGSDYHGPDAPNPALGSVDVPRKDVEALLAAGERLR
jgi:predicted metal-dependent phosphoesterase TrpH